MIEDILLTGVTSLKIWIFLYGFCLLVIDTLFFTYFPLTLLGTLGVAGLLYKFRIPLAKEEDVVGFFGTQFRPSLNLTEDLMPRSGTPIEDQPGMTVKSRLLLIKSPPQMTSTATNGHGGHSNGNGKKACSDGPLVIVAHRGAGLDAPENSLSAIREAKKRGCEAVEFDVSLTKDKVPVLFHDDNLVRIAGIDRDITDMTWEELKRIDISILHPLGEKFRGERVPTFEEAVNLCLSLGMKFIIDLKDDDETVCNAVVELFQRHKMYSMGIVSSFYVKAVYDIRRRDPRIIGCMAWRPGYYRYRTWNPTWQNLESRYKGMFKDSLAIVTDAINSWGLRNVYWWFVGLSAILFNKDAITKEETYRWMKRGVRTYVWTVNAPIEKLHFVQTVQTSYLTDTLDGGEVTTVKNLQSSPILNPSPILRN